MNEPDTAIWMRRLAALSRNGDALPDPALIWWQARMLEKQEARSRAARPLIVAQWASAIVAAVAVIVLSALYWQGIRDVLEPFGALAALAFAGGIIMLTAVAWRLAFSD